jgi:hypothetical protein
VVGACGYGEELSSSINAGNFLTSGKVYWLASQEGLCSMEEPIPVVTWSKAWVCGRSLAGTPGSNPARGIGVSLL